MLICYRSSGGSVAHCILDIVMLDNVKLEQPNIQFKSIYIYLLNAA